MTKIIVPIRLLSEANMRDHWTKKLKRKKVQQAWVKYLWNTQGLQISPPVLITLTRQAPRTLDDDNLCSAFKWIRDTVADLITPGLQPGRADNVEGLKFEYDQVKGKEYKIIITIYSY